MINDGNELFGPQTGDGFAQMATHDEDNNGWQLPAVLKTPHQRTFTSKLRAMRGEHTKTDPRRDL